MILPPCSPSKKINYTPMPYLGLGLRHEKPAQVQLLAAEKLMLEFAEAKGAGRETSFKAKYSQTRAKCEAKA